MAYDAGKDKVLAVRTSGTVEVKLCQYNGGEIKVQVTRFEQKGDTRVYGKLGRMTLDEAREVAEAIDNITALCIDNKVPASS